MNPIPVLPDRLDWASAIGLFIMNFGMLDLQVQDFLEATLPREEFLRFRDRYFRDRVELIKKHVSRENYAPEDIEGFEQFFRRLDPLRDLRNHIAHGIIRIGMDPDQKSFMLTLSRPRDLDASSPPNARHVEFSELETALSTLGELIEQFQPLASLKTTDAVAATQVKGKKDSREL